MMKKRDADAYNHSPAVGTALIVILLLIIFGGMLFWMYSVKLLILPESVSELLGLGDKGNDDSLPWDTGELSGAVKSGKSGEKVEMTFDITYENLRSALLSEIEPEGFYQQFRVCYYNNGTESPGRVILQRYGEKFRVEKYSRDTSSALEMLIIADETTMFYREGEYGEERSIPRGDYVTPESEAGLPSVDRLLAIIAEIPDPLKVMEETETADESISMEESVSTMKSAVLSRYSDCVLTMLRTDDGIVYYVSLNDNELGLREEYYISLEYRVIINHRTLSGDKAIYSCETISFSASPDSYANESDYLP